MSLRSLHLAVIGTPSYKDPQAVRDYARRLRKLDHAEENEQAVRDARLGEIGLTGRTIPNTLGDDLTTHIKLEESR